MSDKKSFKDGDKVVYPAHGVGSIIGEEVQSVAGTEVRVFVVSFEKDKMTLRVPVNRAFESGLRALSDGSKMKKAIATLKGRAKPGRGMWSRRAQEYEAKINSGDVLLISEVVRDLHKNVDDPDRSYSERVIYEAALGRLAGEYSAIHEVDITQATDFIVDVLKSRKAAAATEEVEVEEIQDMAA